MIQKNPSFLNCHVDNDEICCFYFLRKMKRVIVVNVTNQLNNAPLHSPQLINVFVFTQNLTIYFINQ